MKGQLSHESAIDVPAGVVWETYGTLEVSKQIAKLLPNLVQNIQVLEGDGGVGTVLVVTLAPNVAGFSGYKEKLTKVDNEKHVKEVEMVEGGFLDMGFLLYRVRLEILERDGDCDSSIIRSTVEYEIAEESAAYASLITTDMLAIIAEVVGKHIAEEYKAKVNA
ncbi:hypothetical protein MRB53_019335 [Persea americana]|uniref:Uncharacterized protein n=1 Tax=Persea americana TaxID=3435 RepID=A0ACC2KY32_PERAE|nr:hypothetical protein MRB53_019335 [Persea americana]|eukprot:TRINITY_DN9834_c0_g2_i2.p1 TRINITY_DN9834_c0_g2~~TRINITY_DN9834_c0_g2_i2.p1  ORF type:complete len:164 (+),score=32.12 TRINITY_DN9834_c0_g2_i2:319-810(+)